MPDQHLLLVQRLGRDKTFSLSMMERLIAAAKATLPADLGHDDDAQRRLRDQIHDSQGWVDLMRERA